MTEVTFLQSAAALQAKDNMQQKRVLVIDVGGSNLKMIATGMTDRIKIPSGDKMSAQDMVKAVKEATADLDYDVISIGYPGAIKDGKIALEPVNLGSGWVSFDFAKAFSKPVKLINDAAMQALGSYEGGSMLFLGLGTGLGTALVVDGVVAPLEAGHLPYRKNRSFEDYTGKDGHERLGDEKWHKHVRKIIGIFRKAFLTDDVVIGGGNADLLDPLPEKCRLGHNRNAFKGGFKLWDVDWEPAS